MHFTTVAAFLALSTSALAGTVNIVNNCQEQVFLTITRSNQQSTTSALAGSGGSFSEPLTGQGNSYGLTKSDQYYSPNTPKLIFGISDAPPTAYYTLSSVDGDAFAGESWSLSTSDASCGVVTTYDGNTHVCGDSNTFTLTAC